MFRTGFFSQIYFWNGTLHVSDRFLFSNLFLEWNSTCFGQVSFRKFIFGIELYMFRTGFFSEIYFWNGNLHVSDRFLFSNLFLE